MEIIKKLKLRDFEIGGDKLTILAGPCAIESMEILARHSDTRAYSLRVGKSPERNITLLPSCARQICV